VRGRIAFCIREFLFPEGHVTGDRMLLGARKEGEIRKKKAVGIGQRIALCIEEEITARIGRDAICKRP